MLKISESKLKKIRKVELGVNRNLFLICALITIVALLMGIIEFFSRGNFPPPGMNVFYIGILFIYSLHKEMLRWLGEKSKERQGEWFVYSWIILAFILYIINFLTKGYFSSSSQGTPLLALSDITATALEVGTIFILTRLSKVIKIGLEKK